MTVYSITIPAHDCRNCGACCGPTMASENEIELIRKYIAGMDKVYRKKLKGQKKGILDCPYYYPISWSMSRPEK
jgi:Fe-S-cluster containining protein